MTPRATWAESCTPGRVTHAEQVEGQEPDEEWSPGPPGWGLGWGLITLSRKKKKKKNISQKPEGERIYCNIKETLWPYFVRGNQWRTGTRPNRTSPGRLAHCTLQAESLQLEWSNALRKWQHRTGSKRDEEEMYLHRGHQRKLLDGARRSATCRRRNQSLIWKRCWQPRQTGSKYIDVKKCCWSSDGEHPIRVRITQATYYSRYIKLTVIHVYAPTDNADEQAKEELYTRLRFFRWWK